jgi:putative heme-binding domain-containing protein
MHVAIQNADNPLGIASARAVLEAGETAIIKDVIASNDIDAALTATNLLGNTGVASANQLLVETLQDEGLDWAVRDQAVRSLVRNRSGIEVAVDLAKAGKFPEDLKEVAGAAITRSMNMAAVDEAKKYFPQPPLKNDQELPQMTVLLNYIGDAERGKPIFTTATCNQCHIINGEGTNFGPDLSQIGTKLSKTGLYESIIDPSAAISPEYKLHSFALEDGSELLGLLVSETADTITMRLEGGAVTEYPAEDVVDRHQSLLSPMPTDLQNQISLDELVDLVEYLRTLK